MMKLAMKKRQKGVTMVEYALIAATISIAAVLLLPQIGTQVAATFQSILTGISPKA